MGTAIRNMHLSELEDIYKRITEDFAQGEYPPFDKLYKQLEANIQKGWILVHDGRDAAYSICAEGPENGFVLISFFAVYKEYRGTGIGTVFLEKLKEMYSRSSGIIVEVEKAEDALHLEDAGIREKRMEFYSRAGFSLVTGIDYVIWDVPMHLMVFQCSIPLMEVNEKIHGIMHEIYYQLLGEQFIHKLKCNKL